MKTATIVNSMPRPRSAAFSLLGQAFREAFAEHYAKESGGERWITLNGGDGDGTHVKVDGAGKITGGPDALAGKSLGKIDKDKKPGSKGAPAKGKAKGKGSAPPLPNRAEVEKATGKKMSAAPAPAAPAPPAAANPTPSAPANDEPAFSLSNPKPKPKPMEFENLGGKQGALFGKSGLAGQMNLFADKGVPDSMVAKPQAQPSAERDRGDFSQVKPPEPKPSLTPEQEKVAAGKALTALAKVGIDARKLMLYVFGEVKAEFPDFKHVPFASLFSRGGYDREVIESIAAQERAAGREAYIHDGETAGRDYYPANPSPELADAMKRSGWEFSYAPTESERQQAIKLGVPVRG